MRELMTAAVAGFVLAAAAFALPADLVVISDREVRPDEAGGLYYLGQGGGGYLYNASSAAVSRVAPYRVLDRDAQTKDYYIVWAPAWVGVTAEAFAHLGTAVRLSEYEILVGLERGFGPGELRAVEHRIELRKLEPVTPVDWKADAEAPPMKKDPRIAAAINSITAEEYASYIKQLQDFRTRCSGTAESDAATSYIRNFFAVQNLEATLFEFECVGFADGYYPEPRKNIYVETDHFALMRSRDLGKTWEPVHITGAGYVSGLSWLNGDVGFAVGSNNVLAKTVDGGDTWETREIKYGEAGRIYYWTNICFVSAGAGWLAGTSYRVPGYTDARSEAARTTDGGRTWRSSPVPGDFFTPTLAFFDSKRGWAAEYVPPTRPGRILYTTDGGVTWREGTRPPANKSVSDISPVGPAEAWAADSTNSLLHTKDGLTWEYVATGARAGLYQVEFPDEKHGYASHMELVATSDGGATWRRVSALPETVYSAVAFADKDHGVIGDHWGEYLYRTDDGARTFVDIKGDMDLCAEDVIGERRGCETPEEIVIIGGHYDSISDDPLSLAPGAEDNASGTACAMAAARAFRNLSFDRTVRYVAFGDEEFGLNGSGAYAEYCAAKGEKIVAVLNADMVCYDEDGGARDDYSVAYGHDRWLYEYLVSAAALYRNSLIYDEYDWQASDHVSFWDAGYAALGVIEGGVGVGGVAGYPYTHTTEDTLDKLQPELGVRFVRDYAAMLAHLAGVGDYLFEPTPAGTASVPFARPFAVYPNPYCYATCAGGVNFVGLKAPARVEIYDLAGRRVAREEVAAGRDACVWRPARVGGEALSPGVYLYRVEGQEQEESGKVVIAR